MAKRLNYYFRQKVTESELDEGFAYLEDADRSLMTDLGLVGVISGMAVTERGAGVNLSVDVSAGTTYDKDGRRIRIPATQNVTVSVDEAGVSTEVASAGNSKIVSIFAKFRRVLTDPRTDGNSVTVYFQEDEGFEFVVRQSSEGVSPAPVALDPEYILLADITRVFGQTTITNADISIVRREDQVVLAGSPYAIRRGRVKNALLDLLGFLNTHEAANPAHAASSISFAGSGPWADGSTSVNASNVEAAIDQVVSQLASVAGTPGTALIGGLAKANLFNFALEAGTLDAQLGQLAAYADEGPRGLRTHTISSNTTLTAVHRSVYVDTSGGAVTLTLPNPAEWRGRVIYIKDAVGAFGANNCILAPHASGVQIEGVAANRPLSAAWGSYRVHSNGTHWFLGG